MNIEDSAKKTFTILETENGFTLVIPKKIIQQANMAEFMGPYKGLLEGLGMGMKDPELANIQNREDLKPEKFGIYNFKTFKELVAFIKVECLDEEPVK